jgi:hypothetical protein
MAVTFTSHGYDTTTGNPYTEIAWSDAHPPIGASTYGVRDGSDWKVTAVAGADRTVSIAAGFGWGHGVTDETDANDTIQLDAITSGSRWDLIVVRRDWTPTAGESKFMKINGGSTKAIPGGRLSGNGAIDDQPLALVQVTAGQTQPTAIVDLRCWARNGGMVAKDDLVKGYLSDLGSEVYINGVQWRYIPGANDVPEWVAVGGATTLIAPNVVTNWLTTGAIHLSTEGLKSRVTVDLTFKRTGPDTPLTNLDLVPLSTTQNTLPITARGTAASKYVPGWLVGGGNNINVGVHLNPSTGVVSLMSVLDPITIKTNAQFSLNLSYYIT